MEVLQFEINDEPIRLEAENITRLTHQFCELVRASVAVTPSCVVRFSTGRYFNVSAEDTSAISCSRWLPKILVARMIETPSDESRAIEDFHVLLGSGTYEKDAMLIKAYLDEIRQMQASYTEYITYLARLEAMLMSALYEDTLGADD